METLIRIADRDFSVRLEKGPEGFAAFVDGRKTGCASIDPSGGIVVRIAGTVYRFETELPPETDEGTLFLAGRPIPFRLGSGDGDPHASGVEAESIVRAHMPGLLVSVAVKTGDRVESGAMLAVLEAMKMQNEIRAKRPGTVMEVLAAPGASLDNGQPILRLE